MSTIRIALAQTRVTSNKDENIKNALSFVEKAKQSKADVIVFPECFNSPYGIDEFPVYAETIPAGETCKALSAAASKYEIYVIGGSIPERVGNEIYNTCTVWNDNGKLIAKHRKVHLFDIDIKGKVKFRESDALSPGNSLTTFEVKGCKIGLGICHDIRFEEMARLYRNMGCKMLLYPAAFTVTTGIVHWQLLQRSRANDLQMYVSCVSPARAKGPGYIAYGHTLLVNPWGEVLAELDTEEGMLVEDIDLNLVDEVRSQIPVFDQRRIEIYDTILKENTTN